jgi:phospholipid/cholesterol/gamma-HCH transport system substrate-binding protein
MSRTARLGAFILGALILFGLGVFLIGDRQFLFSRTYRLKAPFDTVAGLDDGAVVRSGGVRVGTVERIDLPRRPGDKVTVVMKLEKATREVIRKDSVASVETEGLLGAKYLSVSFGSGASEPVRDGDTIGGRPPLDYADLAKKANEIMETTKASLANVDAATANLQSIAAKIDRGDGTVGALVNDRKLFHDLSAMSADARRTMAEAKAGVKAFHEGIEALKQHPLLRGFVNRRGYPDATELTKHEIAALPEGPVLQAFVYPAKDLFGKPDTAKLRHEKSLDRVGEFLQDRPFGLAVVTAYTGLEGDKEQNLELTQARATVVREYLVKKFRVDDTRIKTKGLGEDPQADPERASRVEILVYPERAQPRLGRAMPPGGHGVDGTGSPQKGRSHGTHTTEESGAIGGPVVRRSARDAIGQRGHDP